MHTRRLIDVQQRLLLLMVVGALAAVTGCHSAPKLPDKNSKAYADVVSAFYTGLAQILNEMYGKTVLPLGAGRAVQIVA